jgi:muconolactone delta-isomerase
MNSATLRHLWSLIEETQSSTLLKLGDAELVHQLLTQLERRRWLSVEEISIVSLYIHSRIPLIRDLAQARSVQTWAHC